MPRAVRPARTGDQTLSIGRLSGVGSSGSDTVALGSWAGQPGSGNDRVSIDSNAFANGAMSVALGAGNSGGSFATRRLINVSAGLISENSTDAVNGSQLFALDTLVTQNAADIVSLRDIVNTQGSGGNPSSGGADTGNSGNNGTTGEGGSNADLFPVVSQYTAQIDLLNNQMADVLRYDTVTHNRVSLAGGTGQPVKVTNVAPAELSATSTDAVNGSQLYATNQSVSRLNERVTGVGGEIVAPGDGLTRLGKRIGDVDARASTGIAMAIASAQIRPNPHIEGSFNLGVGLGTYSGRLAAARSGTAAIGRTALVKGPVALSSGGQAALGAGANVTF